MTSEETGIQTAFLPCLALLAMAPFTLLALGCEGSGVADTNSMENLPILVAEEEMRIGDVDDPDYGFSRVAGVDVDDEGNIYVGEALVPEIRVYDADGVLLRRIGRRGEGPGEFQRAPRFGVFGDTLWTLDNAPDRITLFDLRGTVLSTGTAERVMVPLPSSIAHVLPWIMRPDGRFISHLARVSSGRRDPPSGVEATDSITVPFVLFDATGAVTDTVGWAGRPPPRLWRPPSEYDGEMKSIEVGGNQRFVPQPPSGLPWWLPQLDGYILIESPLAEAEGEGILMFTRFGLAGDTIFSRVVRYDPVPYSAEDLDSIAARGARGESGGMLPFYIPGRPPPPDWEVITRRLRAEMDFPSFQMPFEYPWAARDGSVWLRWQDADRPVARWILIDAEGFPRGELELPLDHQILWSRGDIFWAADPDEFDVPWLVRYRIRPG